MRPFHASVSAAIIASLAAALHAQSCTPDWIPAFGGSELTGPVRALTTFDFDGPGPESPSLVALQLPLSFTFPRPPVMRWTSSGWVPVGGSEIVPLNSLGVLGPGPGNRQRSALAVFDPDAEGPLPPSLFACGGFAVDRDAILSRQIARFDGVSWDHVGDPAVWSTYRIFDMIVFDEDGPGGLPPALYAAGMTSGLDPLVSKWDGSTWTDLPVGVANGPPGSVYDLEVWDRDGPGSTPPALLACGNFRPLNIEDPQPSYLASWNGQSWQAVGLGLPNRPGIGFGMTVFDPDDIGPEHDTLVVVSDVNEVDNRSSADVTLWNGKEWTPVLSTGPSPYSVHTDEGPFFGRASTYDEDGPGPSPTALFVARAIDAANPLAPYISRWNGESWSTVGDFGLQLGVSNGPYLAQARLLDAFATFDFDMGGPQPSALVTGGGFTAAPITSLTTCGSNLPFVDLLTTNMIAVWRSGQWNTLNNGLSWNLFVFGEATGLTALDLDRTGPAPESLYIHGKFATAGNTSIPIRPCTSYPQSADAIKNANARYSAATGWQRAGLDPDIDPRMNPRRILAVADFDPDSGGPAPSTKHIAGSFDQLDAAPSVGPLARWDPTTGAWQNFGIISGGTAVHALLPFDPDGPGPLPTSLFAAGDFDSISFATSAPSGAVLAFDGELWSTTNFTGGTAIVTELIAFDLDGAGPMPARLIAAGEFVQPTSLGLARKIAQFDGVDWTPVGPPGSNFTGSADGSSSRINALAIFNNDLYAAGNFFQWTDGVTPIPARGLAKWNGTQWSQVPANLDNPMGNATSITSPLVHDLVVFDPDGIGATPQSLFAAGYFTAPGGTTQGIARWDGAQWHALGNGVSFSPYTVNGTYPGVHDLHVFDDDGPEGPNPEALFIAGSFFKAGDHSSWAIAKWGCESSTVPIPCPGDANNDHIVNFADITAILSNWLSSGPEGDANHDGTVNFTDITEVLANFLIPCPYLRPPLPCSCTGED